MAAIKVLLLISSVFPSQSEICSLFYTYSAILKSLTSRDIYEFYNSVKLNDIQMSFCNSVNKVNFLTQLCEESERLFRNESDELNYKQQWLQINLNALRNENRTNDTDLHVLQWRHGCAVERHSDGSIIFLHGTDVYAYNGETLTFNLSMHWKPLVLEHNIIWNRESVSSLERKCVEKLTSFTDLQREEKFIMAARPEVYSSVKESGSSEQQVLVCLTTGFYPKHVQMEIRRDQTPLPDEQLNSSGIRSNADGSFQLKKSLEILRSERSRYQCVVKHQTLTEPLFISWDEVNVLVPVIIGSVVALVVLAIIVVCLLRKCVYRKSLKTQSVGRLNRSLHLAQLSYYSEEDSEEEGPSFGQFSSFKEAPWPPEHNRERTEGNCTRPTPPRTRSRMNGGGPQALKPRIGSREAPRQSLQRGSALLSLDGLFTDHTARTEEIRPEMSAGLAAALNDSSDEENKANDSLEGVQTEELHETQSLCEAKETPAAAPTAARGAMGSKNISLPNFAMEREDIDQNTVTQNTLRLPLLRRCRSKNISMPNLTPERKDLDDSS